MMDYPIVRSLTSSIVGRQAVDCPLRRSQLKFGRFVKPHFDFLSGRFHPFLPLLRCSFLQNSFFGHQARALFSARAIQASPASGFPGYAAARDGSGPKVTA